MRLRVMTNLHALAQVKPRGADVEVVPYPRRDGGLAGRVRALAGGLSTCDYVVVNCSPLDLFEVCAVKLLLPFSRAKIVSLDTVLPVPRLASAQQRIALAVKKLLFRQAHLFIEYFKETGGYETHYGIARRKFRYIPFKINRYEKVLATATRDGGYIFCGGNTRRDFKTLIEAVRQLPYPVKIVTMQESVISGHGSTLDEHDLPANVAIVRHDGGDSFLDYIANARLAALPIRRENISASGIGVYLASMALGKCVVISEGPAVNGVVPDGAAVIVPAEDPDALRRAIERAWTDDGFRQSVAAAGQRYALSLKGEERLCESVLDVLLADAGVAAGTPEPVQKSA
jgi:glycosyltransferase involved in cell wall biosynthesis